VLVPIPTFWPRMAPIRHTSPKAITAVRIGFEVLVKANIRKIPQMQGGAGALWAKLCSVKQVTREGPLEVWVRIGTY